MKYIAFFSVAVLMALGCNNTINKPERLLVIKVDYNNSLYEDHGTSVYSLITEKELNKLKKHEVEKDIVPSITYQITANGGFFISAIFSDIYTLGCCEFGSVEKSIDKNMNGELSKFNFEKYENVNKLSFSQFGEAEGIVSEYKKGTEEYKITVWEVDLEYCVCDIYMETLHQKIYGNKGAYIKSINKIAKPSNEEIDTKLKMLMDLVKSR